MSFHKVIGIDLGTTYSAVALWDGREIRMVETAEGTRTVPSVVALDPEGHVVVGTPALNSLDPDPENTIREVKREMGVYRREPGDAQDPGEPRLIRFRGQDYLPQEISAYILMELKRQAERFIGEPVHDAVITVPQYFMEPQRGATEEAAMMAKLNVRLLLNEPTAAAVSFGASQVVDGREHVYVVYDLGGGTFDVSVIRVEEADVAVIGTGGDPRLGGADFDDLLVRYALEQIRDTHGVDLSGDAKVRQRIKREAEVRKRELSVAQAALLYLPYLTPDLSVNVPVSRTTFEALIDDLLNRSLERLDEALDSAEEGHGVPRDQIEQVLLVGGSTRIPAVRSRIAEHLGLDLADVRVDVSPEEAVARGAAISARNYTPLDRYTGKDMAVRAREQTERPPAEGPGIGLQDVTSHTLGVLANQSDFIPIVARDSRIPIEVTRDKFINGDAFTETDVLVFQGEEQVAFDNRLIGKVPIKLPEARERGYYTFAITFGLDQNGLLGVQVKCLNDGQVWRTDIRCDVRAGTDQLARHTERLERDMADPAGEPPAVPANTPAEFSRVARRSFALIGQLAAGEPRRRLLDSYRAFVAAVEAGAADLEARGDALEDAYHAARRS